EPSRFISELDENYLEKKEISLNKKDYLPHKIYAKTRDTVNKYSPANKNLILPKNLTNINRAKNININASDLSKITNGIRVKHNKFGEGKVLSITGEGSNKKATVFFNGIGQKQLLLKFAKLEILT
ncbi:MAG: ATP-dependent DNA helicase, partial [Flavobacteriales bacterium]|nr:ATP-dependent DNA helicase [Flavobacteriales bacterium]